MICPNCGKKTLLDFSNCPKCGYDITSFNRPVTEKSLIETNESVEQEPNENSNEKINLIKKRHGCVTAWLVIMIIVNSFTAFVYLFADDVIAKNLPVNISPTMFFLLGILGLANVIFSVFLLQWAKWGFWGFIISSFGALIINLNIGIGILQSLFGLVGIAILYGILQIKKDNMTAWNNLE